jgi:prepilin signal peptidase PulO-like enzyme (type II secretory pathway)
MNNAFEYLHDLHVSPLGAWLLVAYAFVVGGAFGSFLNVVAYRLPLGMSLNRPGSRCPNCRRPIRWYHNVPVFGWLVLKGRCRDCGAPIAARYPLVELMVSVASGLVLWGALDPAWSDGRQEYAVDLLAVGFRLAVVYALFAAAVLEFDDNQLPLRFLIAVTVLAALGVWLVPELRPVAGDAAEAPTLAASAFAVGAALLVSLLAWPSLVSSRNSLHVRDGLTRAVALILVAIGLGMNALLATAVLAVAIVLATRLAVRFWPVAARIGWAAALLVATLGWMIAVSLEAETSDTIHTHIGSGVLVFSIKPQLLLVAGVLVALLSLASRFAAVRLRSHKS